MWFNIEFCWTSAAIALSRSRSDLPRAATDPTILFLGKNVDVCLKLKNIPGLWKQLQVSKQHMQKYSNDPRLEKENLGLSSLKFLPTVELELAEASMRSKIDEQQGAFGNTQRQLSCFYL